VLRGRIKPRFVQIGHLDLESWRKAADACVMLGVASNASRLDGFLFDENNRPRPNWAPWLIGILAVGSMVMLAALFFNLRLRQKVVEGTRRCGMSRTLAARGARHQRRHLGFEPAHG